MNLENVLNTNDNGYLLTLAEVAKIIKTNIDYVHKLRKSGLLKCIKIGSYKVRKETLVEFLKDYDGYNLTDPYNITKCT